MYTYHLQPLARGQDSMARVELEAEDLTAALAATKNGLRVGSTVAVYKEIRPGSLIPMGTHEVTTEDRP